MANIFSQKKLIHINNIKIIEYFKKNHHESILTLFILIICSQSIVFSQNNSIDRNPINQIDLDVKILGLGISYRNKLFKEIAVGSKLEVGQIFRSNFNTSFIDILKSTFLIDIPLNNKIHIQPGVSYSVVLFDSDNDSGYNTMSIETGLFFKVWRIELGLSPSILFYNERGYFEYRGIVTTLLIVKIPIAKW